LVELTADTPLPFHNRYATPATLGKDRLAGIAGAYARFPAQNCLVIDAGTCITYDVLTAAGDFIGGNISPGIGLRFRALPVFTAGLPLVQPGEMSGTLGNSTESAIRNGVQLGALLEVEGVIARMRGEWDKLNVLLTGGDADFFAKNLKTLIFANPDLVLEGLNKILNYNVQNP
jgi:type III pantothenate kinase